MKERAPGWGDQVWASLQLQEVPIFHGVYLSVSSLVLTELTGRGWKNSKSGNGGTKLVRSLQLHLTLGSAAGMQRADGMGRSQGWEPFPALSLLQAALWLEPSGRGTEASYWGVFWSQAKSGTGLSLKDRIQIAKEWKVAWDYPFMKGLICFRAE